MKKEGIIKFSLIFGGGLLTFLLLKKFSGGSVSNLTTTKKDFTSKPAPSSYDIENAEIVAKAYTDAMANQEPASRLTELNKELAKEFGMRCYIDKSGSVVVCDTSGATILKK